MKKRGREKKPDFAKRDDYVFVRLTKKEKEKIKEMAYSKGLDISEYIRIKINE